MKRLTVRADEVRKRDLLHDPDDDAPGVMVSDVWVPTVYAPGERVEVWGVDDPFGLPALTLAPSDQVEVWRHE